jgi:hypothetical protein
VPIDSDLSTLSDPLDSTAAPPFAPVASRGARAAALVGGLVALAVVMVATFGTALLALFGMAVAWALARRRRRPLTRGASWWGAALGVALGFSGFMALTIAKAPPGTMTRIQQQNDSIVASQPAEPPEWLKRIDPTGGRSAQLSDSASQKIARNPAFLVWVGAMSTMLVAALLGAIVGSLGWAVGLLLAFAATGRWLPRRRVVAAPLAPLASLD